MTMMSMKIHLIPTRHKGSIQITIHTGTDKVIQSKPVLLFQCVSRLCAEHILTFLPYSLYFFTQLVFDAFGNGSAGVGQPEIVLPNGRI